MSSGLLKHRAVNWDAVLAGNARGSLVPARSATVVNHRIIEWFGWEGTFRGHLAQPPAVSRDIFNQTRLLRAPSNLALNVSRDGASTTSPGNLYQRFTTLTVNNFFLISSLNLPSLSLKPLLLVLAQQALLKRLSPSFL